MRGREMGSHALKSGSGTPAWHAPLMPHLVLSNELAAQVGEAAGALVAHVDAGIRYQRHLEQHACGSSSGQVMRHGLP